MREKFFQEGSYKLRLDDIKPKEAKPHNRIHLNFSMPLRIDPKDPAGDDLKYAPTRIRRLAEIVSNIDLNCPRIPITTKLPGIDIEIFATPPTSKTVPLVVCLSNSIVRDIEIDRSKKGEIRLYFSLGIAWDTSVWKWGGKQVFMDCFAKFSQSQSELFDDNAADEAISKPASASADPVEQLARDLGTDAPEAPQSPLIDPLQADPKPRRGRARKMKVIPGKGARDVRPHA
jgi:hypothetical protein